MQSNFTDTILSRMVGAWELTDHCAFLRQDVRDKVYPMGINPSAVLLYTPDGYMSLQILSPKPDSTKTPSTNASDSSGTTTDSTYIAYTGRFDLDCKESVGSIQVVHHVEQTNLPGMLGSEQRRAVKLFEEADGECLELLTLDTMNILGQERLVKVTWKRLPKNQPGKE
ncbi:Lipocalin-like domain-containing protein [Ilyonectria sp. MPI-CAGE-AT-0026]|nr:Lipocalin-like domain-containing protein [Ilyonectria sp. MPI-CAGE-AT-0026]